jgi:hypothetical protein
VKAVTRDLPGQRLSVRGGNPGTGLGDRFKGFRGGSGLFEEGVRLAEEAAVLQGKDVAERRSCTTYPESPILMVRRGSTVRVRQRASRFILLSGLFRCRSGDDRRLRPPSDVQSLDVGGLDVRVAVEEPDRMLAAVAGEVAVMAINHGQAGSHVAREVDQYRV